jgi:hypothetical protein
MREQPYMWFERDGEPCRIVYIGYSGRTPHSLIAERHWDHRGKPWFVADRDCPVGTCGEYFDLDWSRGAQTLYAHNSGGGGDYLRISVARLVDPSRPMLFWADPRCRFTKYVSKARPAVPINDAEMLRRGYKRIAVPLMFQGSRNPMEIAQESSYGTLWCHKCKDYHERETWSVCRAWEWCDECTCFVSSDGRTEDGDKHEPHEQPDAEGKGEDK